MALELVCGAELWCNRHCKTSPVVLEGFCGQVWPKICRKPTRKFPARLPSGMSAVGSGPPSEDGPLPLFSTAYYAPPVRPSFSLAFVANLDHEVATQFAGIRATDQQWIYHRRRRFLTDSQLPPMTAATFGEHLAGRPFDSRVKIRLVHRGL